MLVVLAKCQCPEGSSQLTRWKTVYGGCRHLCTSYLHVYGGAPGQFPCHPGDEEKEDKVLISTSFHGFFFLKKSSSANMICNELNFGVYSFNKYLLST